MKVTVDTEPIEAILSPELLALITQHGMHCRTLSVGDSVTAPHVGAIVVIGETQAEADARAAVLEAAVRKMTSDLRDVADLALRRAALGRRPWDRRDDQ